LTFSNFKVETPYQTDHPYRQRKKETEEKFKKVQNYFESACYAVNKRYPAHQAYATGIRFLREEEEDQKNNAQNNADFFKMFFHFH
jgi:hypothetical protein